VLDQLVSSGDLATVVGYAGTGKSRMLGAAREAWEQAGYRVIGASLSGIAAENLEASSGIESRTLASRFICWDRGSEQLSANDILVIDETGMLGSQQLGKALEEANRHGAKVVLLGDPEQLQAIQAGAAFRAISDQVQPAELVEIWRQKDNWQKEATVQFATGQTSAAIAQYAKHDSVHQFDTHLQAKEAIIDAWNDQRVSQPDKTQIMLAYTKADVADLNMMARSERLSSGELGESYEIQTAKGEREFAENERIYFLKNDRELGVKNGTLGTILEISEGILGKKLVVQLDKDDNGQPMRVNVNTGIYNHLDYGYAATIHKSQGVTVDRTYLLASQYLDRHATYVAMTRHREGAEVFWSKEEFITQNAMVNTLGRERLKDVTLDYISDDYAKASFAAHRGIDTLWDNFWEKHGSAWLEKIQGTIHSLADGAKDLIDSMKEQVAKAVGVNQQADKDAWLDEMRAWVGAEFGKNDLSSSATEQTNAISDATKNNEGTGSAISINTPVTDQQRANNEARYQAIMKESGISSKSDSSKEFQPEKNIQKDKEIDF
jgi:Ti-type conjugative transfer relaxase TraA